MTQKRFGAAEWARRVEAWRASGESAEAFASARGWKATTLKWWASTGLERSKPERPRFVEVVAAAAAPAHRAATVEVRLRNGRRVRFADDACPERVSALVRVLES